MKKLLHRYYLWLWREPDEKKQDKLNDCLTAIIDVFIRMLEGFLIIGIPVVIVEQIRTFLINWFLNH